MPWSKIGSLEDCPLAAMNLVVFSQDPDPLEGGSNDPSPNLRLKPYLTDVPLQEEGPDMD